MDNIRERVGKNGVSYQVIVNVDGKQVSKTFSVKQYGSKKTALEYAKQYRSKLLVNGFVEHDETVDEVFEQSFSIFSRTVETWHKYEANYNKYIKPQFGKTRIKNITASDIQINLNSLVATKSDDLITRIYTLWRSIFKTAMLKEIVLVDQTSKVTKPKSDLIPTPRSQTLDVENFWKVVDELISSTPDRRKIGYAMQIMYYTGMRPSEAFGLTAEDVNRNTREISVNKSIGSTTTKFNTIKRTKTVDSIRTIPYPFQLDEVFDILPQEGYLFIRESGHLFDGDFVTNTVNKVSNGTFRMYTLRHNFSTQLVTNGVDLRTVQELMGHKSATMSLSYARSDEKKKREAISLINEK